MKKAFIIIAIVLLVLGCAVFFAAFASAGFDFRNLETSKLQTRTYPVAEDFRNIQIDENTADVIFAVSADGTCSVECRESEKNVHRVTVEDGTLKIVSEQTRGWRTWFSVSFENESVTVYLPKNTYETLAIESHTGDVEIPQDLRFNSVAITGSTGDVRCAASATDGIAIRLSTGDIILSGASAASIDCAVTTGDIRFESVSCAGDVQLKVSTGRTAIDGLTCRNLHSEGSTGKASFKNVVASGTLTVERDTGDVTFELSDADEIRVKTTTGDVTGSLRTGKTFVTKTSTGDVSVPESAAGGRCEISTSTGDIRIRIADGQ